MKVLNGTTRDNNDPVDRNKTQISINLKCGEKYGEKQKICEWLNKCSSNTLSGFLKENCEVLLRNH